MLNLQRVSVGLYYYYPPKFNVNCTYVRMWIVDCFHCFFHVITGITSIVYAVATSLKFLALTTELDAGRILNAEMEREKVLR